LSLLSYLFNRKYYRIQEIYSQISLHEMEIFHGQQQQDEVGDIKSIFADIQHVFIPHTGKSNIISIFKGF
jgi:hypothetical protein